MKKLYLIFFLLIFGLLAQAQHILVKDFYYAENDLTARTHGTSVEDQNGNLCALIKVRTTEKGMWTFDVGMLGVTKIEMQKENHSAEIWVYVPFSVTRMTIQHEKLGIVDRWPFPCSIEKGCTYVMELTTGKVETIIKEEIRQQYLVFQLDPPNAILEVDDKLWNVEADGTSMQYVDFGTYSYRVRAKDYSPEVGMVTVDDLDSTKIVPVRLKSNLAEVTLTVDADAEIWVNNQKKGVRTWTGKLGNGTYKIECKQAGYETTMISKEITKEMSGETFTLPVPTPIYGSLMVESTPNLATLFLDGKEVGKTPKSLNEVLVGQHEIKLVKDGYDDYTETITITKGERKQVKATLSKGSISCQNVQMPSMSSVPDGALPGKFSVSDSEKVYFSKGNLQYQASADTWRFAEHQWDVIGEENKNISSTYSGWMDLFGRGTGNNPTETSTNNRDYSIFNDWGNRMGGGWHTLTKKEWKYVFDKRKTDSGIRYAKATVNGVHGVILLPDDWNETTYSLNKTNKGSASYTINIINASLWDSTFAPAGAVFLPAAGIRHGTSVNDVGSYGYYWSASILEMVDAYGVDFNSRDLNTTGFYYYSNGFSVRLVVPVE